jgi:hypothetical protein
MITGFSWAWAVLAGVEHEKERKAREKPKMTPKRTRLKTKKCFEVNLFAKSIQTPVFLKVFEVFSLEILPKFEPLEQPLVIR